MNTNILGILISLAYIGLVLLSGGVIARIFGRHSEISRKWIHIMVGNWIFIAFYYFDAWWAIGIVPAAFIIINYLSYRYNLIPAMERQDDSLGTVWYAVSLLVLSITAMGLNNPPMAYVGILTMAYGDGLAALVGKRFGRPYSNPTLQGRSLAGSFTMGLITFGIVIGANLVFYHQLSIEIALATALLGTIVELLGKKGCDNLTVPIFAGLFYYFAHLSIPYFWGIVVMTVVIVAGATKLKALTPIGGMTAFLTAITLFSIGGISVWGILICFFVLGSLQSKIRNAYKQKAKGLEYRTGSRSWIQVICNSLPAVIFMWIAVFTGIRQPYLLATYACFAAAAADTFSSEIGMLSKRPAIDIVTWRPIPSGLSGGVSGLGFFAGLIGSSLLGLFAFADFGWRGYLIVVGLGFFGSLIDSVFGSTIQRKYRTVSGSLTEKKYQDGITLPLAKGLEFVDNNLVNFLSLSFVGGLGIVLAWIV